MQQPQVQAQYPQFAGNDQMVRWNGGAVPDASGFVDNTGNPMASMDLVQRQPQYAQNNSLSRISNNNTALVSTKTPYGNQFGGAQGWGGFEDNQLVPHGHDENVTQDDNIEELEERAQKAKREAHAKRKQIPPFVQKLSSFLEEGKNEDLIRWSNKGDSFIVLDEDEFARKLIPELFKHNKYASFVRQLNMYGFHKRVGLSDNSMRASERKNKSPSEYSNPYFRRGHPNLLWLIQKPKSEGQKGKKNSKSEDPESDEENGLEDTPGQLPGVPMQQAPKSLPATGDNSSAPNPKRDITSIKEEIRQLRASQKAITQSLNQIQQTNRELYNQAMVFQNQHDRHQNSINAILHFLANLFRKSLEEQGGTQNISDILSRVLSNPSAGQQGSVVELGDLFGNNGDQGSGGLSGAMASTPHRRARGLLPPIPDLNDPSKVTSSPSSGRGQYQYSSSGPHPEMGQVTELNDGPAGSSTPPNIRQELENNPQEQMMRIINDHNATNSSGMDSSQAASFVANAPNNLNEDQRNQLANFMNRQSTTPSNRGSATPTPNLNQYTQQSQPRNTVSPPSVPTNDAQPPSLSPIMRSPAMPPLSVNQINSNQTELDRLQQLQSDQEARINDLTGMLGPLSPGGKLPSLEEQTQQDAFFDNNVDIDQYFDSTAFLDDTGFDGSGANFDVNFDAPDNPFASTAGMQQDPGAQQADGHVAGAHTTPSDTGTEEIKREDFGSPEDTGSASKRRRFG